MFGDRERPARLRAEQEQALVRCLRDEVGAYSQHYASMGDRLRAVRSRRDLAGLPLTVLPDIVDPSAAILRPTASSISRHGDRRLSAKLWLARFMGRTASFGRDVVDPVFKPVHWFLEAGLLLGASAVDLERLGEIGRRMLEAAGVVPDDVVVSILPPGPNIAHWQLVLGARRAGLSALHLGPSASPSEVASLVPSVLVGRPADLMRLLDGAGGRMRTLGTVLAVSEPLEETDRARLQDLAGEQAVVLAAWCPPGVRAMWAQCRTGEGLHTWPAAEVIEMIDPLSGQPVADGADGEVVWTGIGWRGTALVRLRTGVYGSLNTAVCPSCGRTTPRLSANSTRPAFTAVLDSHPGVALWQVELRSVNGAEELLVFVSPSQPGHPGPMLRELDRQLSATQYVVLDQSTLARRIAAAGDGRVLDSRARS